VLTVGFSLDPAAGGTQAPAVYIQAAAGPPRSSPAYPSLSLEKTLAARALYLDALGGLLNGSSLYGDLQHSVLKARVHLALVGALR
jgi:hypothetical protein